MKKIRITDALIVFIIAVLILLFVSPLLVSSLGVAGTAIAELLLGFLAIGALLFRKEDPMQGLGLRLPPIRSFMASVVFVLGANALQNASAYIYVGIFNEVSSTDYDFLANYFSDTSPFVALVCVALIPAVCEELLFRGYLLNAFKTKKKAVAVIITALLFAAIHLDPYKLVPIFIMGLAYGYIAVKTESVVLPMIFHFINNALSLVSFYTLKNADPEEAVSVVSQSTYLWMGIAAVGMGIIILFFGIKLLAQKKFSAAKTVAFLVTGGVILTVGAAGMVVDMTECPYSRTISERIREDTVYTDTFTLEENKVVSISASAMTTIKDVSMVITDREGDTVFEFPKDPSGTTLLLEKGEYTVTYTFNTDEDDSVAHNVNFSVRIISYMEYDSNGEQSPENDKTKDTREAELDIEEV